MAQHKKRAVRILCVVRVCAQRKSLPVATPMRLV